jgi:hypothetical protein
VARGRGRGRMRVRAMKEKKGEGWAGWRASGLSMRVWRVGISLRSVWYVFFTCFYF